jgi:hypothetical protein
MNARGFVLAGVLVLVCLLAVLTVSVIVSHGLDILVIVSLLILALLGFGVLGALTTPPPDE